MGKKFQLTDLKVAEVSMVDSAANKRKFSVIKADNAQEEELEPTETN